MSEKDLSGAPSTYGLSSEADGQSVLAALRKRVDEATGPDPDIDAEIAAVVGSMSDFDPTVYVERPTYRVGWDRASRPVIEAWCGNVRVASRHPQSFTASVDAALGLIERCSDCLGEPVDIILGDAIDELSRRGWNPATPYGPQLALALLRALMAALEAERPDERQASTEGRRDTTESAAHGGRG